ncbi:hypothetical protein BN946_scf184937.g9 [Trametes cinnabarina]|uniref:Uncharacterized protein n=1 Tax=Pycnoporus cinnabarinus TaxID=5643 RepID=A0A060SPV7_PYCCI|nr:hypothetical protein BN946_scf184937.g9 [Trametes cinnabarina]
MVRQAQAPTVSDPGYYSAAMSYHEWKRESTLSSVLFNPHLPYSKPRGALAAFLWRRRVWLEVTFALSMLEPWEKILIMLVLYATFIFLAIGAVLYLPHHIAFLQSRAAYYLFGVSPSASSSLAADAFSADSFHDRLKNAASWGLNASLANVNSLGSSIMAMGWGSSSSDL